MYETHVMFMETNKIRVADCMCSRVTGGGHLQFFIIIHFKHYDGGLPAQLLSFSCVDAPARK